MAICSHDYAVRASGPGEVDVTEGRGVLVYFDDDRASESYAEHVASYPGRGGSLVGDMGSRARRRSPCP